VYRSDSCSAFFITKEFSEMDIDTIDFRAVF
jgi:hypothetical protein